MGGMAPVDVLVHWQHNNRANKLLFRNVLKLGKHWRGDKAITALTNHQYYIYRMNYIIIKIIQFLEKLASHKTYKNEIFASTKVETLATTGNELIHIKQN